MQDKLEKNLYSGEKNPFVVKRTATIGDQLPDELKPEPPASETQQDDVKNTTKSTVETTLPPIPIQWSKQTSSASHSNRWYIIWTIILLALIAVALVMQLFYDSWQFWTSFGLAVIIFITLTIAGKSTSTTNYNIDQANVTINKKTYPISDFRAFTVKNFDNDWVISLIPTQRFASALTLDIDPEQGEIIVDFFGSRLPMERTEISFLDRMIQRLKL